MTSTAHAIDLSQLGSGGWVPTCTCGWTGTVVMDRGAAQTEARDHAPNAPVEEHEPSTGQRSSPPPARPSRPKGKHLRERSEMTRQADGTLKFRAVCACGWKSSPVDMSRVGILWEHHTARPS